MSTILQLSLLDESGDSYHRMRWPGRQLAAQAPQFRVINLDFRAKERIEWGLAADLLVVLHCGDMDLLTLIEKRRAVGKKTLVEINDNFYSPQPWNSARELWNLPGVKETYEKLIKMSDGVIVTGPGLAQLLHDQAAGKIHILENHFPAELPSFSQVKRTSKNHVVMGWAGSAGHMADLLFILPELRYLLAAFPNLKIHLMGDPSIPSFVDLPQDRFGFVPFGPIQNYFDFWNSVDIGFIPLLDTPYNRCRSDIKMVEIAGKGALPIVQQGLTYEKFIAETNCPSFGSLKEFREIASLFIRDSERRLERVETCYQYVKKQRIGFQRRERLDLYSSMMSTQPSSNFRWELPLGYQEVRGQIDTQLRWGSVAKPEPSVAEKKYLKARAKFLKNSRQETLQDFEWLLEQKQIFEENKNIFDEVPQYVLEIWKAALEARNLDARFDS